MEFMINDDKKFLANLENFTQNYLLPVEPLNEIELWFSLDDKNSNVCAEIFHLANRYGCIPTQLDKKRNDIQAEMLSVATEITKSIELCNEFIIVSANRHHSRKSASTTQLVSACHYKLMDSRTDEEKQYEKEQADKLSAMIAMVGVNRII